MFLLNTDYSSLFRFFSFLFFGTATHLSFVLSDPSGWSDVNKRENNLNREKKNKDTGLSRSQQRDRISQLGVMLSSLKQPCSKLLQICIYHKLKQFICPKFINPTSSAFILDLKMVIHDFCMMLVMTLIDQSKMICPLIHTIYLKSVLTVVILQDSTGFTVLIGNMEATKDWFKMTISVRIEVFK